MAPTNDTSVDESAAVTTFLFTDIEGSTRLWEREPERMRAALAAHDAIARACVADRRGMLVKSTGDGIHAVFADPRDALAAAIAFLRALADPAATAGLVLPVRCGMHAGVEAQRDNDFFGNAVNRAARVMSVAHGGQILVSQAVATLVGERLPEGVALLDLGSVRLRGLTQPERVWQVEHPALRREFPALRSLEATPHNLPQQLTSFVGRAVELADVLALLREARLLTVLGGGGFGKTRLTLQAAAQALDGYDDGVWLVELAPVGDPRLVPQAVASALGVKEAPGRSVQDAVLAFARSKGVTPCTPTVHRRDFGEPRTVLRGALTRATRILAGGSRPTRAPRPVSASALDSTARKAGHHARNDLRGTGAGVGRRQAGAAAGPG